MKKTIKTVAVVLLFTIVVGSLLSCSVVRYNAKIYSDVDSMLLDTFKENNTLYHCYNNSDAPRSRSFIIADKAAYDAVFKESAFKINFDREMLLVFTFNDVYPSRRYYVDKISVDEEKIAVYIRLQHRNGNDAVVPYQRWIAVKMRKKHITSVEFYEVNYIYGGIRYDKFEE